MRSVFSHRGRLAFIILVAGSLLLSVGNWNGFPGRSLIDTLTLPTQERGFICKTYVDDQGRTHNYVVFVPYHMSDSDHLPMLLYLNGLGKNGTDGIAPLLDGLAPAIWEVKQNFPFVVVWPQCPSGTDCWKAGGSPATTALAMMQRTLDEFHCDADRVFVSGLSSGGWGALSLAAEHPELFAAVVPISAMSLDTTTLQKFVQCRVPLWSFFVEDDNEAVLHFNRSLRRELLDAGRSPRFTEIPLNQNRAVYHHDAWDFAFRNQALFHWLLQQHRQNRADDAGPFQPVHLSDALDVSTGQQESRLDESKEGVLLQQVDSYGSRSHLLTNLLTDQLSDVHLEFRSSGDVRCGSLGSLSRDRGAAETGRDFTISINSLNTGGIYDHVTGTCLAAADPVSEAAFIDGGWNELRLMWREGRFLAELNGWPLIDTEAGSWGGTGQRLVLETRGQSDGAIEWRHLRIRPRPPQASVPSPTPDTPDHPGKHSGASLKTVIEAWRRRERNTRCASISWRQDRHGFEQWTRFGSGIVINNGQSPLPSAELKIQDDQLDVSIPWNYPRTRLSGQMGIVGEIRFNDFEQALTNRFANPQHQSDSLGVLRLLRSKNHGLDIVTRADGTTPLAVIPDRTTALVDRLGDIDDLYLRAPLLALRPLSPNGFGINPEHCQLVSRRAWAAGIPCLVIEEQVPVRTGTLIRRYWVDSARNFAIVRATTSENGQQREQINITYSKDDSQRWIPTSWSVAVRPLPGSMLTSDNFPGRSATMSHVRAHVTVSRISNEVSSETVDVRIPPTSLVLDQTTQRWFQQLNDNQTQALSPHEVLQIATNTDHRPSRTMNYWIAGGALLTALVILLVWRCRPGKHLSAA